MSINTAKLLHLSMPSHLGVRYIISEHIHVTVATWWTAALTHCACVVHVVVLFWCVIFCGLKSQSHLDNNHATAPCFVHVFCSGSPHNVMHSSSNLYIVQNVTRFHTMLLYYGQQR